LERNFNLAEVAAIALGGGGSCPTFPHHSTRPDKNYQQLNTHSYYHLYNAAAVAWLKQGVSLPPSPTPHILIPLTITTNSSSSSTGETNPRGIPVAPFVEDVESFVTSRSQIEPNLKKFQEMIAFVLPPLLSSSTDTFSPSQ
jgi:hypothetical protein